MRKQWWMQPMEKGERRIHRGAAWLSAALAFGMMAWTTYIVLKSDHEPFAVFVMLACVYSAISYAFFHGLRQDEKRR